jgi:ABC-type cobalamin transport system ATPase subunit
MRSHHQVVFLHAINDQDWPTLSDVLDSPYLSSKMEMTASSDLQQVHILHLLVRYNPPTQLVAKLIKLLPNQLTLSDKRSRTVLHIAGRSHANIELTYHAACTMQDLEGKTPLHFACDGSY